MLDLKLADLLPVLPPITGNTREDVAVAMVLRYGCLAEIARLTMDAWDRAPNEVRGRGAYEANLMRVWQERVATLLAPTEASWWLEHGRGGAGGAIGPASRPHESLASV